MVGGIAQTKQDIQAGADELKTAVKLQLILSAITAAMAVGTFILLSRKLKKRAD